MKKMHIIKKIFKVYEEENIMYCSFKSNQYLNESFKGLSDFDILVDYRAKTHSDAILTRFNCKKFEPAWIGRYPGVENWLAFDNETGDIYHIHLHYQIIIGKELVNEYVLPWNDLVLQTAIKDLELELFIANPNLEILFLLTRITLKRKIEDTQVKFDYLKERVTESELKFFAEKVFPLNVAHYLQKFIFNNGTVKSKEFIKLSTIIRSELKYTRRMNVLKALILYLIFKCGSYQNKILNSIGAYNITKKVTASGGKIIAFIGVDGSGKSTISQEINSWLARGKVECKKIYMGSGDGAKNIFATIVSSLHSKIKRKTKSKNPIRSSKNDSKITFFNNPRGALKRYVQALVAFSIAKDKRKKLEKMHRYRLNGGFSVLDRYPQLQQSGINDGLKIKKFNRDFNSKFLKKMEAREEELMQIVNDIYPDLVFRLNISIEVCMARKSEHTDIDYFKHKTEAIKQIQFPNSKLFELNAEQSLDDVLLTVKRTIWNNI